MIVCKRQEKQILKYHNRWLKILKVNQEITVTHLSLEIQNKCQRISS